MSAKRDKYKRLEQLYVVGKELVFEDGTVMWVQVMNPLQLDEARTDAQTARARMMLALKEIGSPEQAKSLAAFTQLSREEATNVIVNFKWQDWFTKANTRLRDEEDWVEKVAIMDRSPEMTTRAPDDPERLLVEKIHLEYIEEVQKRMEDDEAFEREQLAGMADEEFQEEYLTCYRTRMADAAANVEYAVTEAWYCARACEGVEKEPTVWDHSKCERHMEQVWETKEELRAAPEKIQTLLKALIEELSMSVRDAKNSDSTTSSSASSVLPSEPEASTPSTQGETPSSAPGISTLQSSTA